MSEAVNWKERIVELVIIKQTINELDTEGLWEYRLPRVAATPAQLEAVEAALGEPLDPGYRDFLEHAGGWPAFWQTVDLFGPEDLLGGERFRHATEMLTYVEVDVLTAGGLSRTDLLPIAASPVDLDLFLMMRRSSPSPGVVVWVAGSEVDRFPTFEDFFLAMVDYNRLELEHLKGISHTPRG
jgi:hypothetical protein